MSTTTSTTVKKRKKKKRKETLEAVPLERRPPVSPRPIVEMGEKDKEEKMKKIEETPIDAAEDGVDNAAYVGDDENNNHQVVIDAESRGHDENDKSDHILGVHVHRTDHITFSMRRILVKVNVMSGMTNQLLGKSNQSNKSVSYYETERRDPVSHIMPIMTAPFQVDKQHSLLPAWEELLQFNENYNYITDPAHGAYFVFQVQDCIPGDQRRTVAWAKEHGHRADWTHTKSPISRMESKQSTNC